MSFSLFREQAIEEQKSRLHGSVIITQPFSFSFVTLGIMLVVICVFLILIYSTYARRVTVSGYLVPDKGLVKVFAPIEGVVSKQHIEDGQQVNKGDLLLTISTLKDNVQGGDLDALLLSELKQQKFGLEKSIVNETLLSQNRNDSISIKTEGVKREIAQLKSSIKLQETKVELSIIALNKLRKLFSKGHISEDKLESGEQFQLDSKLQLQTAKRQLIQLENQLSDLSQKLMQSPFEWQRRLTELKSDLSDIDQRILEVSARRQYSIRAPVSGRLTVLQVSTGQTLNPQTPVLAILPEGAVLNAELFLPTRAAGFIARGQDVYLRYEAFPYQHYGLHEGKVINISQVILAPNELPIPIMISEPVYRVKVELEHQFVTAYEKKFQLQTGMLLDANIILEERTLGQWLLEPIYGLKGKL